MPSLNRVEIIGHVGRDAELRHTPSGAAVCNFSVATSERWTDKTSGEKKEHTEWHNIQVWGKRAEVCGEYVRKGNLVYVSGSLRTRSYEGKDGAQRYVTEINANEVLFLSKADKPANDPVPGSKHEQDGIPF